MTQVFNHEPFILDIPQDIIVQQCESQRYQTLRSYLIPEPFDYDEDVVTVSVTGISPILNYSNDQRTLSLSAFQS